RLIWSLAEDLWPHPQIPWPDISLGIVFVHGTITLPVEEPQENQNGEGIRAHRTTTQGATRLLQILLSEAAHLIWVMRCERTIPVTETPHVHTEREIKSRWLQVINVRLTADKL
ncbi:hypothetical protein BGY98DRAFT_889003, partial [Russula aff. rugulosa BPL654]